MITEGNYIFYVLQHRTIKETPWCKPDLPLTNVKAKDKKWMFSNWDVFGLTAEPWHDTGNEYRPKYKSHNETYDVWSKTGYHGWWSKKYGELAIKRLKEADKIGKFDVRGPYRELCQRTRHEFRLVKINLSYEETVIE